jgi:hypothetical protein
MRHRWHRTLRYRRRLECSSRDRTGTLQRFLPNLEQKRVRTVVKDAHAAGLVGSYDAAVVTKDANGKVHENKDEAATRHGAWWGVAAGAAVGVIFPPAVLASAAAGGVIGGISGHLAKGMSRSEVDPAGCVGNCGGLLVRHVHGSFSPGIRGPWNADPGHRRAVVVCPGGAGMAPGGLGAAGLQSALRSPAIRPCRPTAPGPGNVCSRRRCTDHLNPPGHDLADRGAVSAA